MVNRAPAVANHNLKSDPPALAFGAVGFRYGDHQVVRDVTFALAAGEMVGLLGPNGAGKSTLMRLGAGTLRPQVGVVQLDGVDIRRRSRREIARRLAVAPQEFTVQFAYTVRQIVALGRMPHHDLFSITSRQDNTAVEEALTAAGIDHLAGRVFNDLSGGERQRVLIALTLAQEAPILLLDEPTAHLDIRYQIETLELLRRLNAERKLTVLAALHDLNLAARYFPRLLLLRERIVADGAPAQVLDAQRLSEVYETPVRVGILRGEQHLSVLPPSHDDAHAGEEQQSPGSTTKLVHVVAGGGSGELVMRVLADAQVAFSAGPLNVGDSDYTLAQRLATVCLVEPPYAPVSADALVAARARMFEARTVILCPMPLGPGNIALVEAALSARQSGVQVALLEPTATDVDDVDAVLADVGARDFSQRGTDVYRQLLALKCPIITSAPDILSLLGD